MTIASTITKVRYLGNGNDGFTFPFYCEKKEDLIIQTSDADTDENIVTHVIDTDCSVSGLGVEGGGSVYFYSAPATGRAITIYRRVEATQNTDFENQGGFFANIHESAFDKLTEITQQLQEQIDRCPKASETSGQTGEEFLVEFNANVAAAEAAASLAAGARDAAQAAQAAAELAETHAETAETAAETAETNAETAESNAEAAQAAAEAAQVAAEAAQAAAEAAGGGVEKVADKAARLALTPDAGKLVLQLDNNTMWEWTGTAWNVFGLPGMTMNVWEASYTFDESQTGTKPFTFNVPSATLNVFTGNFETYGNETFKVNHKVHQFHSDTGTEIKVGLTGTGHFRLDSLSEENGNTVISVPLDVFHVQAFGFKYETNVGNYYSFDDSMYLNTHYLGNTAVRMYSPGLDMWIESSDMTFVADDAITLMGIRSETQASGVGAYHKTTVSEDTNQSTVEQTATKLKMTADEIELVATTLTGFPASASKFVLPVRWSNKIGVSPAVYDNGLDEGEWEFIDDGSGYQLQMSFFVPDCYTIGNQINLFMPWYETSGTGNVSWLYGMGGQRANTDVGDTLYDISGITTPIAVPGTPNRWIAKADSYFPITDVDGKMGGVAVHAGDKIILNLRLSPTGTTATGAIRIPIHGCMIQEA